MTSEIIKPEDFQTFTFENGASLRVIVNEMDEPLFFANDVCNALGYGNSREALAKHCKESGVTKRDVSYPSGSKTANFIDESNVYRLIMRSKLPKAEEFQDWVCGEVLPTIRKTGQYQTQQTINYQQVYRRQPKLEDVPVYRLNDACVWLSNNDKAYSRYNHKVKPQSLMHNLIVIGMIYKDVRTGLYVPSNYALDNDFARNVPIKQMVTFDHDGKEANVYTKYTFGMTERGLREYLRIIYREARKRVEQMEKERKQENQKLLEGVTTA